MLDSKSATRSFVGSCLLRKGIPKFFPRLSVILTCENKFERLFRSKNGDHHRISGSWFTNLTDTQLPPIVTKTLSLSKNFGIPFPNNQLHTNHLFVDFESNIHKINEDRRKAAIKIRKLHL